MKIVGATGLGGLWAWHIRVTNLRCVHGNPNSLSLIVSEISALDLPLCLLLHKLTNVDIPLFLSMYVSYFADHRREEI